MARIAVIGAGMGAMAAAARLAVAGHRVVVYERSATFGGALARRTRGGFAFDEGPGLLQLPAVYRDLFVKTGKEPLERCVELSQIEPAVRHVFADGVAADLPNASRAGVAEALDATLGEGAGVRWSAFMNRAREAWDRTRRPLLEEPLWPNWRQLEREPYPAVPHRRLLRRERLASTLTEIADLELGGEPRLRALLEQYALVSGLDPRTAPASAAVLPYMEQTFGVWSVRGGMHALARAVYERCLARRVEFRFGAAVARIVEKDGRAAGVELADGGVAEAEFVVAGVAPAVLDGMLPGRPVRAPGEVAPQSGVPSRLTVLLALRGARREATPQRTVVHTSDREAELESLFGASPRLPERPTVTVLRPGDPDGVPDGEHEAVTLTAPAPAAPVPAMREEGGGARAQTGEDPGAWRHDSASAAVPADFERQAQRMIDGAARVIPGLRDRLLWHDVRTPADVEEITGAPGGSVPTPALAAAGGRLLHPSNGTRLPGLFTVGGWSHPGGGLPHAGMSGALVAGLIVEGPEFRGSR